jgi:hypothetical protein
MDMPQIQLQWCPRVHYSAPDAFPREYSRNKPSEKVGDKLRSKNCQCM